MSDRGDTRCLAVFWGTPWAERLNGAVIRRLALLRGLEAAGSVDCWCAVAEQSADADGGDDWVSPSDPPRGPVRTIPCRWLADGERNRRWWARVGARDTPYRLTRLRLDASCNRLDELVECAAGYDSVWLLDEQVMHLFGPSLSAAGTPWIADVDDLQDRKAEMTLVQFDAGPNPDPRRRRFLARVASSSRRWSERVLQPATRILVAKDEDVPHFGSTRVEVVPNGCSLPSDVPRVQPPGRRPLIMFHGYLVYNPNWQAAQMLVRDVAPRVASQLGRDLEIRVVGEAPPDLAGALQASDGVEVTLTGYVEDIADELRTADLVAVPLRVGGGTRIKILEAWAHRVPVVSTALGCEGLGAVDGEHLLVADEPEAFADACVRILRDDELRARITERGHDLAATKFDWRRIEQQVAELRRTVETETRALDD